MRRFAGKLQSESVRLGALVNELIALSRLQGAEPLPDLAVVEVDAVVDETIARVATAAENAGITVTSDEPSGLLVRGDRSLLVTALTNLVDNAINYSPAGTQVSMSRTLRDGQVQISVTDRGRRHRPGVHRAGLRTVLPDRPGPLQGDRRHRARAGHRQARRGQPRRHGDGLEPAGHRFDLHPAAARPCPRRRIRYRPHRCTPPTPAARTSPPRSP